MRCLRATAPPHAAPHKAPRSCTAGTGLLHKDTPRPGYAARSETRQKPGPNSKLLLHSPAQPLCPALGAPKSAGGLLPEAGSGSCSVPGSRSGSTSRLCFHFFFLADAKRTHGVRSTFCNGTPGGRRRWGAHRGWSWCGVLVPWCPHAVVSAFLGQVSETTPRGRGCPHAGGSATR